MDLMTRLIRPWATAGPEALDSLVMEARDRWPTSGSSRPRPSSGSLVGLVVTTRDPVAGPGRRVHRRGA